jgi:hypothetical protein
VTDRAGFVLHRRAHGVLEVDIVANDALSTRGADGLDVATEVPSEVEHVCRLFDDLSAGLLLDPPPARWGDATDPVAVDERDVAVTDAVDSLLDDR